MVKIGLVGAGTVGSSVIKILEQNKDIIKARAGDEIAIKRVVVKDPSKKRGWRLPTSADLNDVLQDPEISIVLELMGGVDRAKDVVERALAAGKSVVTANKALLAYHRYELERLAKNSVLAYEASVAGGIPIIKALRDGLGANHITSIKGIINGTCNYMLTKMAKDGTSFEAALKEAQDLGYAEADPSFDIGGFDASHKLLILASIAYGIRAKPEDILIEGIEGITKDDVNFASEFGYVIKHLGIAKRSGGRVSLRVHSALIAKDQMIAKVDGVLNGVSVVGDCVGETLYYGAGAGGDATASAVISDIIDIVRGNRQTPMLGYKGALEANLQLMDKDEIDTKYYVRILVDDKPGVLAQITSILAQNEISVETLLQKTQSSHAQILFSTHTAREKDVQKSLQNIEALEAVLQKPVMIRIED